MNYYKNALSFSFQIQIVMLVAFVIIFTIAYFGSKDFEEFKTVLKIMVSFELVLIYSTIGFLISKPLIEFIWKQ